MTSSEKIRAGFETSSGADQFVNSANTYNDNQWHYAVVTNDGSTLRLYIDGVQVATKSTAGASPKSTGTKPVYMITIVFHLLISIILFHSSTYQVYNL